MKTKSILFLSAAVAVFSSCESDPELVNLGIDDTYGVYRMQTLRLHPEFEGDSYTWTMVDAEGEESVVSTERDYYFVGAKTGVYNLSLTIVDGSATVNHSCKITVWSEEVAYTPYISKVLEFRPMPGQFVNELPRYEDGDTEADMCAKVLESIGAKNEVLVSLGGYGGYVTFSFDHTVANVPGEYDFMVKGNAFYASGNPSGTGRPGGSSEPGIVMVSLDCNGNGLPDDEWYELAGSEYYKDETKHNYTLTYHRPGADHVAVPENSFITDKEYIKYTGSDGAEGWIEQLSFHRQDYWPAWIAEDELSFTGTMLASNAIDESGAGSYFVLYCYDWGYTDNHPNSNKDLCSFNLEWAVDADGNPVKLAGADFIRVYTGVNQQCGWLGETSTEISGAVDLHIEE